MKPDSFADLSAAAIPAAENDLSRRYLKLMLRWVPVAMEYYNDWPVRPGCGHFFGGVLWYGQETSMPVFTLALASSSQEYDAAEAGMPADELRQVALRGLRYLCFTHDTGPADCVRPTESWGRTEPAGTKWGERGRGFFPESQCGRTIASLAVTAALIADLLGDEERGMLGAIAADYLDRFGTMAPKSGVYFDTQMEENAWTALGLSASLMLPVGHDRLDEYWRNAALWMFRTATMPRDAHDSADFAGGQSVRELCGRCFTMLPDGTAENHGFVHPSYLSSGIGLAARTVSLLRFFGREAPPHLFRRRRDIYNTMKPWFDATGASHCPQGMNWPYFAYPGACFLHAAANVYLGDADAAGLEGQALATLERSSAAHAGRMVPARTVRHCHGQQDPAVMRERMIVGAAEAYLAHRLAGRGEAPPAEEDFERRVRGVYVYPHGGALVHRHARGVNSLAWRNRTMANPATREGARLIGPAEGLLLASVAVAGKGANTRPVALTVREAADHAAVLLVEDLAEGSVRREVLFASLPDGRMLLAERLTAREAVTVESFRQGFLSIINDDYFDGLAERRIFWAGGERVVTGWPGGSDAGDETIELAPTRWVNVDDRCGLIFEATGRAVYRNRHHFEPWRATEDDLILGLIDRPQAVRPGGRVASMVALWCPEQSHERTAAEPLEVLDAPPGAVAVGVEGFLCACNFSEDQVAVPALPALSAREPVIVPRE